MIEQYCKHCESHKPLEDFWFDKKRKKRAYECRKCTTERASERRKNNPERAREINSNACKRYAARHPEKVAQIRKEYVLANKERISKRYNVYQKKHRKRINARICKRRNQNPQIRLGHSLRATMRSAVLRQSSRKFSSTRILLGCSASELRCHIESKWLAGMSWDNYGKWKIGKPMTWHIDHIRPCASFDLTDSEEQRACFHWSNLQPLWAVDNLSKNASWIPS